MDAEDAGLHHRGAHQALWHGDQLHFNHAAPHGAYRNRVNCEAGGCRGRDSASAVAMSPGTPVAFYKYSRRFVGYRHEYA